MVFRLERRSTCFLIAAVFAALFCLPYLTSDFLAVEHDTFFHLSRIQGLAEAISRGDLLPAIYPYKNNGFGYASPLFYCDLLLTPFSLLYLARLPLAWCYKLLIFCATLFSVYAVLRLLKRTCRNPFAAAAAAAAFCFSNYRITDVYVRGAAGEMMAIGFLVLCITALYDLLEQQDPRGGVLLFTGLCGLVFSHNLTFVFGAVCVFVIVLFFCDRMTPAVVRSGLTAVLGAFLCTAWFTLPMLEQLADQSFILNYYASSSRLERYALPLWKYAANTTVFGYGENDIEPGRQMLVNIGLAMTALSLLYPVIRIFRKPAGSFRFIRVTWILGMICLILPWDIFPWEHMAFLRVLQFPWRLMTPALVLLLPSAAASLDLLVPEKKTPALILTAVLLTEGLWHLAPAFQRSFGITSHTSYQDITSGVLIDPYYSATYMRVELAGGDYLPIDSPDFRTEVPAIRDSGGNSLITEYKKDGTLLSFSCDSIPGDGFAELPLTYYKGYVCTVNGTTVPVSPSGRSLAEIRIPQAGTVIVRYRSTPLRQVCIVLSLLSFAVFSVFYMKKASAEAVLN